MRLPDGSFTLPTVLTLSLPAHATSASQVSVTANRFRWTRTTRLTWSSPTTAAATGGVAVATVLAVVEPASVATRKVWVAAPAGRARVTVTGAPVPVTGFAWPPRLTQAGSPEPSPFTVRVTLLFSRAVAGAERVTTPPTGTFASAGRACAVARRARSLTGTDFAPAVRAAARSAAW